MSWRGRHTEVFVAALILCAAGSTLSFGQADGQLVYRPLVTDGVEYRRLSYPEQAGPLVVPADSEVVIEALRAPVSYWPITREYLADLSQEPQTLPAGIEIIDSSGTATLVEPDVYVIWHPAGVGAGPAELVRGEAATALHEDYVTAARASATEVQNFEKVRAEHRALVEAWIDLAGKQGGENMPDPPPELGLQAPEPYRAYASEPRQAAVVSLPEGEYTVRLRGPDGEIVPGSERPLISFGPLAEGVGYVLRPEDRWTQPVVSFAPDEVIYTTGETDLFFQPVPVVEYNAQRFTRLFRPQSVEAPDPSLTVWVPREERDQAANGAALALWSGDTLVERLPQVAFRVAQIPGAARGYTIEEFAQPMTGTLQPDFTAMRMNQEADVTSVSLAEDSEGIPVNGSLRRVRVVSPPATPLIFLPALLPLAIGVAAGAASARRKRPKS